MTSISETTAVSIRKGNTEENDNFTGLSAEVTADLGIDGTGTDINTTLRLHNGIHQGGIKLARADLVNVTTEALATNRNLYGDKNLAYADLSNIEETTNITQQQIIRDYMHEYGLALNTQIDGLELTKANVDMSNVNTVNLATSTGHTGNNLAYANMSNVDTTDLATSTGHTGENLAYVNMGNVNTLNLTLPVYDVTSPLTTRPQDMSGPVLANADLSNIDEGNFKNKLDAVNVEYTTNKEIQIDPASSGSATAYPTTGAVVQYVNQRLLNLDFMNTNLDNATSWEPLYATENSQYIYANQARHIIIPGSDFTTTIGVYILDLTESSPQLKEKYTLPTIAPTSKSLNYLTNLKLAIYALNNGEGDTTNLGKPEQYRLYPEFGTTDLSGIHELTFTNSLGKQATGQFLCTDLGDGLYHYAIYLDLDLTDDTGWNAINSTDITQVPCYENIDDVEVIPVLTVQIDEVFNGKITKFRFDPAVSDINRIDESGSGLFDEYILSHPVKIIIEKTSDGVDEIRTLTTEIQAGDNALFNLVTITSREIPAIGGASLLKTNLENLPGMQVTDIIENNNPNWHINKIKPIPDLAKTTIQSSEYERIATVGQVWESAKKAGALPSQTGNSGKFLTTDGTNPSWCDSTTTTESSLKTINGQSLIGTGDISVSAMPSQAGNAGKFLTTNGTTLTWSNSTTPPLDDVTINTNTNDALQVFGVIEKNTGAIKYDWVGTLAEWTAGRTAATFYAWANNGSFIYTTSATPTANDKVYTISSSIATETDIITSVSGTTITVNSNTYTYSSADNTTATTIPDSWFCWITDD